MYLFFFFKQNTAYDMRMSDWSSDVCSSDLDDHQGEQHQRELAGSLDQQRGARRQRRQQDQQQRPDHAADHRPQGGMAERVGAVALLHQRVSLEIGRAACRERGGQYVEISVVAVVLNKKTKGNKKQE